MEKTKLYSLLLRVERISGWVLLPLIVVYFISGFAMAGDYGLNSAVSLRLAHNLHTILHVPLLIFFVLHAGPAVFFAVRRWRKSR